MVTRNPSDINDQVSALTTLLGTLVAEHRTPGVVDVDWSSGHLFFKLDNGDEVHYGPAVMP